MTGEPRRGRREPCEVCTLLAEQHPGRTVALGRQRADGRWFCDRHRTPNPTPDPSLTLDGLKQTGYVRGVVDNAVKALGMHVDPSVLREALEAAIRQHSLSSV